VTRTTIEEGESIPFSGVGSTDPDGTIETYAWDFGDGRTATGPTVRHTYSTGGSYMVTLTVTDNDGLSDITAIGVIVKPPLVIEITSLQSGDEVPISTPVRGTISGELPEGQYIWVVINPHASPGHWWPQGRRIEPLGGQWHVEVWLGREEDAGMAFDIAVILVNEEGDQRYRTYLARGAETGDYPGIPLHPSANIMDVITVIRKSELPGVTSAFAIKGEPFRFVGGSVGGKHMVDCDEACLEDLVVTAKENGISVLVVYGPEVEDELGVYSWGEAERRFDYFLDLASTHGVYVMITLIDGMGITKWQDSPYYNPVGIEGLIKDERLRSAYKQRLEYVVMHRNTVNGRIYRDDPTILAWTLINEPISAPFNYPVRPPEVTAVELSDWFQEMALHMKSLDSNHLVTICTTAAIDSLDDWIVALDAPALDFIYAEDADALLLGLIEPELYLPGEGPSGKPYTPYTLELFTLGKPVVVCLDFTSGVWDLERIGRDYVWQANTLQDQAEKYFEAGAAGVVIFTWGSALFDLDEANFDLVDRVFFYDATNEPITAMLKEIAAEFDTLHTILEA